MSVDQDISGTISMGLHQATQPLTILQGTLELALLNASTVDEYKEAIERSLEELQRVTECFDHLRMVTQSHHSASDVTTFAVSPMVQAVLTGLKARFAAAGVELILESKMGESKSSDSKIGQSKSSHSSDSDEDYVRLSPNRFSEALKTALSELLPLLESGSRVVVLLEAGALEVLIRINVGGKVQQAAKVADAIPSPITASQKLAQAMAASAGGELTFLPSSQGILIRLPKASASSAGAIFSRNGEVAHV